MFAFIKHQKGKFLFSAISRLIVICLSFSLIFAPSAVQAQSILNLPIPGTMVAPSPAFVPVLLKGMTIHPENPLQFDFIIDSGNTEFTTDEVKAESEKLVKYFLASMTIPKDDLWVNLSPYEDDRVIPDELGKTELGRDMLAQDYILKQLTASLMYPEKELGKKFWDKVYQKAEEQFGTSEIPVNTFNKVWILPESATVYEHEQTVYVVNSWLKVMLDSDYQAMQYEKQEGSRKSEVRSENLELQSSIIKEIIIPEIEKEVNQGEHFAPLRQIYHSLILAKWYKETIKNSLLSKVYVDKNMTDGVNVEDETIKDQIYDKYMQAYKKGVFNYIKEDYDRLSNEMIPRKYFSGGINRLTNFSMIRLSKTNNPGAVQDVEGDGYRAEVKVTPQKDGASSPVDSSETFDWDRLHDQIIAIEMELNRNSPELTEEERSAIVSVENNHALAGPGIYESEDDTARRMEETREIREAYDRARERLKEIVAPKVDKMIERVQNKFDEREIVNSGEALFPRSHGTYLGINRKVAQEFGYSISGSDPSSSPVTGDHHFSDEELNSLRESDEAEGFRWKRNFDEYRVRAQLSGILDIASDLISKHPMSPLPPVTAEDKIVIEQVEELNFLAGPGVDNYGEDLEKEIREHDELQRKYYAAKEKMRSTEERAKEEVINEIIQWVKRSKKNFKKEELVVLSIGGQIAGRVDRGIAEKFGFAYRAFPDSDAGTVSSPITEEQGKLMMGATFKAQGVLSEAIEIFEGLIEDNPDFTQAYVELGIAYIDNGQPEKAVNLLKEAIERNPNFDVHYYNIGLAYFHLKSYEEAAEMFLQYTERVPGDADGYYELGNSYHGGGKLNEAKGALREAIRLNSQYGKAHFNLGLVHLSAVEPSEAIELLKKGVSLDPSLMSNFNELMKDLRGSDENGPSSSPVGDNDRDWTEDEGKSSLEQVVEANISVEVFKARVTTQSPNYVVKVKRGHDIMPEVQSVPEKVTLLKEGLNGDLVEHESFSVPARDSAYGYAGYINAAVNEEGTLVVADVEADAIYPYARTYIWARQADGKWSENVLWIKGHSHGGAKPAISLDGKSVVTGITGLGMGDQNKTFLLSTFSDKGIWEMEEMDGDQAALREARFSDDGKSLFIREDGGLTIWNKDNYGQWSVTAQFGKNRAGEKTISNKDKNGELSITTKAASGYWNTNFDDLFISPSGNYFVMTQTPRLEDKKRDALIYVGAKDLNGQWQGKELEGVPGSIVYNERIGDHTSPKVTFSDDGSLFMVENIDSPNYPYERDFIKQSKVFKVGKLIVDKESVVVLETEDTDSFRAAEKLLRDSVLSEDSVKRAMALYQVTIDNYNDGKGEGPTAILAIASSRLKRLKTTLDDFKEEFDIVDENGADIEIATRAEAHAKGLRHKGVNVMIFSADGKKFLGQIRASSKDVFGGAFSNGAAGHVKRGEGSRDSALKELGEEIVTKDGSKKLVPKEERLKQIEEDFKYDGYLRMFEYSWLNNEEKEKLIKKIKEELGDQKSKSVEQVFYDVNEELSTIYVFTYNRSKKDFLDEKIQNISNETGIEPGISMDNQEMKSLYTYQLDPDEEIIVNDIMAELGRTEDVEVDSGEGLGEVAGLKWVDFDKLIVDFNANPEQYTDAFTPFLSDENIINKIKEVVVPRQSSSPVADKEVGGIDLNQIDVNRQGGGVDIQFDPIQVQEMIDMGITGFAPVIINFVPLPSVLPLLGLAPQREEEEEFELSQAN